MRQLVLHLAEHHFYHFRVFGAYLLVRDFGFDLDGIPDGSKQVKEALRSSLGNLKRKADRRFEQAEEAVNDLEAVFQGMRVSGKK